MSRLVIYGAWYFSRVAAEAAQSLGYQLLGRVDPAPPAQTRVLAAVPDDCEIFVAIGDNHLRETVALELQRRGRKLATLVHPTAVVSPSASVGDGCYVAELAVVRSNARLDAGVVLQAGAVVSHDVSVERFASFGPNAACASKSHVGARCTVGVGASIRPDIRIGEDSTVAAGAAVLRSCEPGTTLVGNPARATRPGPARGRQSDWSRNEVW